MKPRSSNLATQLTDLECTDGVYISLGMYQKLEKIKITREGEGIYSGQFERIVIQNGAFVYSMDKVLAGMTDKATTQKRLVYFF